MGELTCPLQEAAELHPIAPAIIAPHRTYTYAEYHAAAAAADRNLRKSGLGEGGVLAIALPPGTPYPILLLAAFRLGITALPLNTRFPAQHIIDTLKRVGCRSIVTPYGASLTTLQGRLYALAPRDLIPEQPAHPAQHYAMNKDLPALIVLTSGSTGAPKAALHSFGTLWHSARRANANIPVEQGDRWLLSLPLFHVAGIGVVLRCLAGSGAVVLAGSNEGLLDAIQKYEVTHVSLVATQLHRLLRQPTGPRVLRGLKAILMGGSAMPQALLREAHDEGLQLATSYGLTETASQITATRAGDSFEHLLTSGRALDPGTIRVGEGGQVEVCGGSLFLGYAGATGIFRPYLADGWFATSDTGYFDAEGYLHITGRSDNVFISGGENIQPEEIEQALLEHNGVAQAMVVPAPHPEFVQAAVAFVEMRDAIPPPEAELQSFLKQRLPPYKVPRRILLWPVGENTDMKVRRQDFIKLAQHTFQ